MSDILFENYQAKPQRQSFIIPLTYPDISLGAPDLERIGYGGDIWELRVDLLSNEKLPLGVVNLPSLAFVKSQVKLLQDLSPMPILFTIRTVSQGGKFPDDASKEALELMLMAVSMGCQYIDVEIEWPIEMIQTLVSKKGPTKLVASYHSWTGKIRWTSSELKDRYQKADEFGDIIKLSILSVDVYDCHELALFVRNHMAASDKPLLAVGMGQHGQLSRVLSPISLVTHKLLSAPSAPGQLTLAEVHSAQYLVGKLPKLQYFHIGDHGPAVIVSEMISAGFNELGLPHISKVLGDSKEKDDLEQLFRSPGFGGATIKPHSIGSLEKFLEINSEATRRIGWVDTITTELNGSRKVFGTNLLWDSIFSCLNGHKSGPTEPNRIITSPADQSTVQAACYAAEKLGFKSAIYIGSDSLKLQELKATFSTILFQQVESLEATGDEFTLAPDLLVIIDSQAGGDMGRYTGSGLLGDKGFAVDLSESFLNQVNANLQGWKVFGKEEIVKRLTRARFTALTGRKAPFSVMA